MLNKFELPHRTHMAGLYSDTLEQDLDGLQPARLVPVLRTPEGHVVGESLAIAETLAERHSDVNLWPKDPALRMRARWMCAEMASGFAAIRSDCPMQLQHINRGFQPSQAVSSDIDRIENLWCGANELAGSHGRWLFGEYCLADVFYAPIAARMIGYDLDVSADAKAYCMRTLSDPSFKSWRAEGLKTTYDPFPYPTFAPLAPWPGD